MNKTFILFMVILCTICFSFVALAQEQDTSINSAQNLEIKDPTLLPDSPFYFLKEWTRNIQSLFTFNNVKKAELKQKFSDERLVELQKLVEKGTTQDVITKATDKYKDGLEKTKQTVDKIKDTAETNEAVDKFLDKFTKQTLLHEEILQKLENQVSSEAFQKIKEAREQHIEKFGEIMEKLQDKNEEKIKERIQEKIQEHSNGEFKEIKAIQILDGLSEKLPEKMKEKVQELRQNMIQNIEEKIENLPAEKQETLKTYIENVSGDKAKVLDILESLKIKGDPTNKEKIIEYSQNIIKKIKETNEQRNCPMISSSTPDFCPNGKISPEKNDSGCVIFFECLADNQEGEDKGDCPAVCLNIGTDSEGWYNSCDKTLIKYGTCKECKAVCKEIGAASEGLYNSCTGKLIELKVCSKKQEECKQVYSPVCGTNGKTYTNDCYAKIVGTQVAYEGECKPQCEKDSDCQQSSNAGNIRIRCVNKKCVSVTIVPQTNTKMENDNETGTQLAPQE